MASISGFGIASARPIAALAALSLVLAAPAQGQAPGPPDLTIEIAGLRDARGVIRLCLTNNPRSFPECTGADAVHATVTASLAPVVYHFRRVPAGTYAISAFHDANSNGRLDTMMGIPREGFAFSRNPALRARAPHFNEASFTSNGSPLPTLIMKYLI